LHRWPRRILPSIGRAPHDTHRSFDRFNLPTAIENQMLHSRFTSVDIRSYFRSRQHRFFRKVLAVRILDLHIFYTGPGPAIWQRPVYPRKTPAVEHALQCSLHHAGWCGCLLSLSGHMYRVGRYVIGEGVVYRPCLSDTGALVVHRLSGWMPSEQSHSIHCLVPLPDHREHRPLN
jgi:hypothetical protein